MAGRDVGEEPERVLKVGQQAHIRIWKRWPRASLEMLDRPGSVSAADDVQPFLYVALMLEVRFRAHVPRLEERVEIKIRQTPRYSRSPGARPASGRLASASAAMRRRGSISPGFFAANSSLTRCSSVYVQFEDLLLDELARGQGPERCARKVEVGLRGDGQELGLLLG